MSHHHCKPKTARKLTPSVEEIETSYELNSHSDPSCALGNPPTHKRRKIGAEDESSLDPTLSIVSLSQETGTGFPTSTSSSQPVRKRSWPGSEPEQPTTYQTKVEDLPATASHKRVRRQSPSPKPERAEKRTRGQSDLDSITHPDLDEPGPSKRRKADLKPVASSSKPTPRPQLSKTKSISGPSGLDSSLPNFIPGLIAKTAYAQQVEQADELREAGNNAYQAKDYEGAIDCYTAAAEVYPRQPLPHGAAHPGSITALANRASAHMALNHYRSAAQDLRQSMQSTILPPLLPESFRTTLAKRIFRLVKCYLALLQPKEAAETIEHVYKSGAPVFINHVHPLWQEMSTLYLRIYKLQQAVDAFESARKERDWACVLTAIATIEKMSNAWAYHTIKTEKLPGPWTCWKAEAQAWLGWAGIAQDTLNSTLYNQEEKILELHRLKVQGLISYAQMSFGGAIRVLDRLLETQDDVLIRQTRDRAHVLQKNWSKIEPLVALGPSANHDLIIKLSKDSISGSQGTIEAFLRIKLGVIICEAEVYRLQAKTRPVTINDIAYIEHESEQVLSELKYTFERREDVPSYLRCYVLRALLCRARAKSRMGVGLSGQSDYEMLSNLLSEPDWQSAMPMELAGILHEIKQHVRYTSWEQFFGRSSTPPRASSRAGKRSIRDPKGYYAILQVSHQAQSTELKKAYRTLCRTHHPDKGGQTAVFQQLQEAFETLSDPANRRAYDRGSV